MMIKVHYPNNELELAFLKGILDSEEIFYFVHNDHFGSLKLGPSIALFNEKTILVHEDHFERAKELIANYLSLHHETSMKFSFYDKLRMIIEVLLFSWFIPGKRRKQQSD